MMSGQTYLFELGCEELPPKAIKPLAESLLTQVREALNKQQFKFADCRWFATPRRLAIQFDQLAERQPDRQIERLGPAVAAAFDEEGNPKPAALGFARSCGVSVDELQRKATDKGERLAYTMEEKGRSIDEVLPEILEKALSQLPVPKAMRWGNRPYQFSRPVHWLVSLFGRRILALKAFGLEASDKTYGHRFHAPEAVTLEHADNYVDKLKDAKVLVDFGQRCDAIRSQVEALAEQNKATCEIDPDLLEEVAALVEWPVALCGQFDAEFLEVPAEALISSMAEHQKYFHLKDYDGQLINRFVAISNIESKHSQTVVMGNEKVIRPRLADAKFFYDTDRKQPLASRIESTKTVTFQKQLGSLFDKAQRVGRIAENMAEQVGANQQWVSRAASLCKCDLMTDMVYEFPELQGIMGRYYALYDGEEEEVAKALDEIYMPRFAGDHLPDSRTGTLLAIAERIDTLTGIFGIGLRPSGAKDPFALRRAALGVIRLIAEKDLPFDIRQLIEQALAVYSESQIALQEDTLAELLAYFKARLTAFYQEQSIPTQAIQAVLALPNYRIADIHKRIFAVAQFMQREEADDLAEANKRVANILAKSETRSTTRLDTSLLGAEELALFEQIESMHETVADLVAQGDYAAALNQLALLKPRVNNFFDNVMINVDDETLRRNRLALISQLRDLFLQIADISLLQK